MSSNTEQGKSERPPPGCRTAAEIIDNFKAAAERRRIHSETLPPPARIFSAADTFSTVAAKIFLEASIRAALIIQRGLTGAGPTLADIPAPLMAMCAGQADAHRRAMRDAYLSAALEILKMIGGDFDPEPWDFGEEPSAGESSKLKSEEQRICELYHGLTEPAPTKG